MADVPCPLGMLLDAVAIAIARMDFEVESHCLAATANHVTRCRSLDDAAGIRRLATGVRELCRTRGRNGVSTWAMVADLARLVAAAIEATGKGEGEPWLRARDRVRELLDELRVAGPQDEPVDGDHDVAVRSAVVPATPSRLTQARPPAIGSDTQAPAGGKGEKGDNVPTLAGKLTRNPRAILRAMMQEGATTMARSWNASELADHARLSCGQMRRAMETLRKHGLYESHRGQDGGVWLTPLGMAVAESMQ
jgi:hypothetical protein